MADSTVIDLYVVSNDRGRVAGRPVLTALLDGYSYLCLGYSFGWEGIQSEGQVSHHREGKLLGQLVPPMPRRLQ